jgi:glutamate dehydrogenase (NAD(P)+)
VVRHKATSGSVTGLAGTKKITNAELLALPCDILIPAAFESQIRADNADAVRARLIAEAANGPTTPAADAILFKKGIPVLPDILANSGGVTVSYFEWVQNIDNDKWDEDLVNSKLLGKMQRATQAVIEKQEELNEQIQSGRLKPGDGQPLPAVDLRTTALVLAIERVAHVALERGIWP